MAKEYELIDIQNSEILGLISHFSEHEIGRQLGISHETVDDFILSISNTSIYEKSSSFR